MVPYLLIAALSGGVSALQGVFGAVSDAAAFTGAIA